MDYNPNEISFDLSPEQARALERMAGKRKVRLSGQVRKGRLVIDYARFADEGRMLPAADGAFVAVNAPFKTKAALGA